MAMDYVVGSVAALITGNVTPNRPKHLKRALTPVKHQASPNVTPKSELVGDRSVLLSPTLQKRQAVAKKSPKRIFDNPDLNVTKDSGLDTSASKVDAEKVKKHLSADLDSVGASNMGAKSNSTKSLKRKQNKSSEDPILGETVENNIAFNKDSPKKKNKQKKSTSEEPETTDVTVDIVINSPKKRKNKEGANSQEAENIVENDSPKKKNKRKKKKGDVEIEEAKESLENTSVPADSSEPNLKKKKKKNKKKKKAIVVNPNAITEKDTDSEHESDNEIHSDNEKELDEAFKTNEEENHTSEDEEEVKKESKGKLNKQNKKKERVSTDEEIKRTLFVGNVPFTRKIKKHIKTIFRAHGRIETIRIRGVPVKDARTTPKVAVIKNELHPERTTVNVYVKYCSEDSVQQALVENNRLMNECHLRVSRSDHSGALHDPNKAVFIGNIPFALEDEALRAVFAKCGDIVSVRIVRDKKTNVGKGFGYVNFESKDGVELALSLPEEELTVKNKILRVKRCTQLPNDKNRSKAMSQPSKGQPAEDKPQGAYRRVMNKRNHQEDNKEGPPPQKKQRKEFVGVTAEKKKKNKFNKGQKKNKALSEILTK